jgi:aminoglycoside phosphotransferase (APT) family kinase protein
VRAGHERERRLLPALAAFVSFRVPVPLSDDVFVYEKVPGRPFAPGDDVDAAFTIIDELHSFPVEEARRLLGFTSLADEYAEEWTMFSEQVLPHLPAELVEAVAFQRDPPALERETLIHDDLGPEHVLVDDAGRAIGLIDFEDASIGDPVCDFVPLTVVAGRSLTEGMRRYRVRGTLHAIAYFHREGKEADIAPAVAELRRRLDLRPGQ